MKGYQVVLAESVLKQRCTKEYVHDFSRLFLNFIWTYYNCFFSLSEETSVSVLVMFLKIIPFLANFLILYPLKKTKKFCFSGVFKGHKIKTLVKNGFSFLHFEDTSSSWYATFLHYMKSFSTHYLRFATKTVFSRFFFKKTVQFYKGSYSVLQRFMVYTFLKTWNCGCVENQWKQRGHFLWILSTEISHFRLSPSWTLTLQKSFFH